LLSRSILELMSGTLVQIYTALHDHFGAPVAWWPIFGTDPPFEMLLGAILVQQTRWESVEQAVLRLRAADLLTPHALAVVAPAQLADLLRPVAYYRQKAAGIGAICSYLCERYAGSTAALLDQPTAALRDELLALPRIGPETADVILLYAGGHPVFVIDNYTRRLMGRVLPDKGAVAAELLDWARARYAQVQAHMERELAAAATDRPGCTALYAAYHALINEQCVRYCVARRPRCDGPPARRVYSVQAGRNSYLDREDGCPLRPVCAFYQAGSSD
jgi:endonuclease-3 related protein